MTTINNLNAISPATIKQFGEAVNDQLDLCLDMTDEDDLEEFIERLSTTRDSFASFAVDGPRTWNECAGRKDFAVDGMAAVAFARVQSTKGRQRVAVAALDLGDITLVYQF